MFYETAKDNHGLRFNPMKALVVPRPIGWITAMSAKGETNPSPYSFFNILSVQPDIVGLSSEGRKNALVFAEETKEFVCNFATYDLRDEMNETATAAPRGENEMLFAGLEAAPCKMVTPPCVKGSPVVLECRWLQTVPLWPLDGSDARYDLVLGQVVCVFIEDILIKDGLIDSAAMKPIARAGYNDYFVSDASVKVSLQGPESV